MNSEKELTCIVCPMGCSLKVSAAGDRITVTGHSCPRGEKYAVQEMTAPKRNISSTVKVTGGELKLAPVKTGSEIPREVIFDVMKEINKVKVDAPVKMGQVIIENVLGTGVDIVATRDIEKK